MRTDDSFDPPSADPPPGRERGDPFLRRAAAVIAMLVVVFLAWQIRATLLIGFAGIVVAIIVDAAARPLRSVGLSQGTAVSIMATAALALIAGLGLLAWPSVQAQASDFVMKLSDTLASLRERYGWMMPQQDLTDMPGVVQRVAGFVTSWSAAVLGALSSLVLVVIAGGFLASAPHRYRDGVVRFFPPREQPRARRALDRSGRMVRAWLFAQLLSMAVVGVCVAAGTWALGLPSPIPLGVLAALAEFVPILGPIAAALPALLLALNDSLATLLWTGAFYLALQQIESNVVLPIMQQEVARIPPALLILAFVAFGSVFGIGGVLLSAPLTAALIALVTELYVRRINGEE